MWSMASRWQNGRTRRELTLLGSSTRPPENIEFNATMAWLVRFKTAFRLCNLCCTLRLKPFLAMSSTPRSKQGKGKTSRCLPSPSAGSQKTGLLRTMVGKKQSRIPPTKRTPAAVSTCHPPQLLACGGLVHVHVLCQHAPLEACVFLS